MVRMKGRQERLNWVILGIGDGAWAVMKGIVDVWMVDGGWRMADEHGQAMAMGERELEVLVGMYKSARQGQGLQRKRWPSPSVQGERGEGQQGERLRRLRCLGAEGQIHLPPREGRHLERVEAVEEAQCSLLYIQGPASAAH